MNACKQQLSITMMYSISIYCCKLWWATISWFDSISINLLENMFVPFWLLLKN